MGRSRTAGAPQYARKPGHLRIARVGGAPRGQDQRDDRTGLRIILLGSLGLCAGLCHRNSLAAYGTLWRIVRRAAANPIASSVGIDTSSKTRTPRAAWRSST